jgi:hypothetical protein
MLGRWLRPAYCASTSVTFEPARHTASILFELLLGCWGMPPNRSKIRRGEAPQIGVACENPLLDRKQPTSLSEYDTFASSSIYRMLSVIA